MEIVLGFVAGALLTAGGMGYLWYRFSVRVAAFLVSKGLTLPK